MGVFVTSSLPGRTLMPREAGDEPRYLSPDGACQLRDFVSLDFPRVTAERAHCWRNVWLKVQTCLQLVGLWGAETRSPSGSRCLFSPFHWAQALCQHLISAGPQLLTPVAWPAILPFILFYLVCMMLYLHGCLYYLYVHVAHKGQKRVPGARVIVICELPCEC